MAVRIDFLGHATCLVELAGVRVLTDPLLLPHMGPLVRVVAPLRPDDVGPVDVVLISHLHHDHCHLASLRLLGQPRHVVVPRGAGQIVARSGLGHVREQGVGEILHVGRLTVTTVPAVHDGSRGPLGPVAETVGYLLEGDGESVYFAGDTALYDEMESLAPRLDVALLPVWGWGPNLGPGHMDPQQAADAAVLLRPRLAVPIHWGTFFPAGLRTLAPSRRDRLTEPPHEFAAAVAERGLATQVRVTDPGHPVALHG